jgi:S1-C subfamily serine protease
MHKVFSSKNEIKRRSNSNIWENNGSGFLISKSGYIATNHHVIDGWSQFKVEFKRNNKLEVFNARLVQSDKTNDLAILKIEDESFSTINELAYNFKLTSVDIGTEIFALGYPLTDIMGDNIKFTDGKISAKTGYGGDVTTYQIQVPIQPGNSGGPLFDLKGNLIGVASSGINRKLDLTENVNYAIKTSYLFNLIDVLPEKITLPSSTELASKKLTEQIKILSDYVVIIKVK